MLKTSLSLALLPLAAVAAHVTWRARHFGVRQRLTNEITAFDRPRYFQDRMLRGAFAFMEHDHYFVEAPGGGTEMLDVFRFSAPLGWIGRIVEITVLRRYMARLLEERNAVIRDVAEGRMPMLQFE
ncbi:MAG: SRPBCC family protein [Acidobacteria bacterium]|nr:SRPBCC family protein [Acidobacteriota bacterium]